jgi:photosystem II stability/assembly factor-like uncharacterized protein
MDSLGNSRILKTEDGGRTWSSILSLPYAKAKSIYFTNQDTGFVVGHMTTHSWAGFIQKTTDGGKTWNSRAFTKISDLREVQFINAFTGWVIGNQGMLKTSDGGQTWLEKPIGFGRFSSISFLDDSTGWISDDNSIYGTKDGGETWGSQYVEAAGGDPIQSIHFLRPELGWAVTWQGAILKYSTPSGIKRQKPGISKKIVRLPFGIYVNGRVSHPSRLTTGRHILKPAL